MPKQRIAEMEVALTADDKKFKKAMVDGKKGMQGAEKQGGKLSKAMDTLKASWIAVAGAMYGFIRVMKYAISEGMKYELHSKRLNAALKNQGVYTNKAMKELQAYALQMQRTTGINDAQTLSGMAMLASFKLNTEQIQQMTPHLLNLAAFTEKTTGTMSSLEDVAKQVGRALEGTPGSLTEMGISLSALQKQQLLAAEGQEKLNVLMEVFQQNAGGMAVAAGETAVGGLRILKESFNDLAAAIGENFTPEAGTTTGFAAFLDKITDKIKVFKESQELARDETAAFFLALENEGKVLKGASFDELMDWYVELMKRKRESAEFDEQEAQNAKRRNSEVSEAFDAVSETYDYTAIRLKQYSAAVERMNEIDTSTTEGAYALLQAQEALKKLFGDEIGVLEKLYGIKLKNIEATESETAAIQKQIAAQRKLNDLNAFYHRSRGPSGGMMSAALAEQMGLDDSVIDPTINSSGGP